MQTVWKYTTYLFLFIRYITHTTFPYLFTSPSFFSFTIFSNSFSLRNVSNGFLLDDFLAPSKWYTGNLVYHNLLTLLRLLKPSNFRIYTHTLSLSLYVLFTKQILIYITCLVRKIFHLSSFSCLWEIYLGSLKVINIKVFLRVAEIFIINFLKSFERDKKLN